jgi:DNA repair exonuclease SbcCD ATPase subunit
MPRKAAAVKDATGVKVTGFKPPVTKSKKLSKAQAAKLAAAVKDDEDYDDDVLIDDAAAAPVVGKVVTMTDDAWAAKVQDARDAGYDEGKQEMTVRLESVKKKLTTWKEKCSASDSKIEELDEQIETLTKAKTKLKDAKKELENKLVPLTAAFDKLRKTFDLSEEEEVLPVILECRKDHLWSMTQLMHCMKKSDQKDLEYAAQVGEIVSSESVPVVDDTDSTGSSSGK